MERLAEKREQHRVDIRKKQHNNMLFERRMRIIEESGDKLASINELEAKVGAALERFFTEGSLDTLREVRKLSCRESSLGMILQRSEDLANRCCILMDPNYDYTEPQREATWLLANLTSDKKFAEETAVRLNVAGLMLRRMNIYGDLVTKECCLWTINNLLPNNPGLSQELILNGIVKLLMDMIKERLENSQICTLLTTIIRLIGTHESTLNYTTFRPFNRFLFQLLNMAEHDSCKHALFCLSRFTQLDSPELFVTDLRMAKIMKRVIAVASLLKSNQVWFVFLVIAAEYACNSDNVHELVKENILSLLDSMVREGSDKVVCEAIRISKRLLIDKETLVKFMEHKLVSAVFELAQQGTGETKQQAIEVIVHCMLHGEDTPSSRVKLIDMGWILRNYYQNERNLSPALEMELRKALDNTDNMEPSA